MKLLRSLKFLVVLQVCNAAGLEWVGKQAAVEVAPALRWGSVSRAGDADDRRSSTENSVFDRPTDSRLAGAVEELEFRGVVQNDGKFLVSLFNRAKQTSQWLSVPGHEGGLEVHFYDPRAEKLQVTWGGRMLTLTLRQSHVVSSPNELSIEAQIVIHALRQRQAERPTPDEAGSGSRVDPSPDGRR